MRKHSKSMCHPHFKTPFVIIIYYPQYSFLLEIPQPIETEISVPLMLLKSVTLIKSRKDSNPVNRHNSKMRK